MVARFGAKIESTGGRGKVKPFADTGAGRYRLLNLDAWHERDYTPARPFGVIATLPIRTS
jgi:hypothetical protein